MAAADDAYDGWLKDDLIAEADNRGLSTYGTKAELVSRLLDDDEDQATQGAQAAAEVVELPEPEPEPAPAPAPAPAPIDVALLPTPPSAVTPVAGSELPPA